jgi:hypothetical protein
MGTPSLVGCVVGNSNSKNKHRGRSGDRMLRMICSPNASLMIGVPPLLALLVGHVPISSSSSCELCPAFWTRGLAGDARFLSLMSKEVAEGGELSTIAAVVPALRLWPGVDDSHSVL